MKIRFLNLAQREVDDAVVWYEQQAPGLSRDFLDQLDRAVRLVKSHPRIATQIDPEIRRFLFSRFPYSLIYGIDDQNRGYRRGSSTSRTALLGRSG